MDFINLMSENVTTNYISGAIQGIDFMSIFDETVSLLPALLPVIVAFIGFRKGLRFLIGSIKRA